MHTCAGSCDGGENGEVERSDLSGGGGEDGHLQLLLIELTFIKLYSVPGTG